MTIWFRAFDTLNPPILNETDFRFQQLDVRTFRMVYNSTDTSRKESGNSR